MELNNNPIVLLHYLIQIYLLCQTHIVFFVRFGANDNKVLGSYALSDWKLCHIQPVGFNTHTSIEDLEISDIEDHFRKYVNPNNMFVLPKEIGYLGEIDVFIEEQKR